MKAREILNHTNHRPFEVPKRSWMVYQEWNKAIFFHWEVEPNLIKPLLPKGIDLDMINGKTWVSLVAFDMNNINLRNLPKISLISDFHEINIRVYVTCNGKPSVYFLCMEGSKKLSCTVLKAVSKLPYRYSKMKRYEYSYESKNDEYNDSFFTEYSLEDSPIIKDETDIWLTERYAVFQDYKNHIIEYDVHHVEWPTQQIDIKKIEINYPRFNHLINNKPDRIHYSKGVQVLSWNKKRYQI